MSVTDPQEQLQYSIKLSIQDSPRRFDQEIKAELERENLTTFQFCKYHKQRLNFR